MARPLCSSCRRRPASYLRSASGKPLCTLCLERSLARAVKRSLRGLGVLERGSLVAVVASSFNPYGLAVTTRLLEPSARASGARLEPVAPGGCVYGRRVSVAWEKRGAEVDALDAIRLERAFAAEAARLLGASAALLPIDATTLSMLGLEAFMSARLDYLADAAGRVFNVRGVKVAYSLAEVEAEAVAAYAALSGPLEPCTPPWRPRFRFKHVFHAATRGRGPELLYGGLASARQLSEAIGVREGACPSCGAPGYSGLCPTCSSLGLERLRLLG